MTGEYDAIVIGLGGMGAAALATLARRGRRVLGIEQFGLGHERGSSHGHTRVIRTAYFEHPAYVPLCKRAFAAWRELERRSGVQLLVDSPCLSIGRSDGDLIAGVRAAAAEHNLPIESLDAARLRSRYPQFQFDDSYEGVLEQDAGFLYVDRCVRALHDDARQAGATICEFEPVLRWDADDRGVSIETEKEAYRAKSAVLAAGPWAAGVLGACGKAMRVMRQTVFWYEAGPTGEFAAGRLPVFLADTPDGCFYGVPATDDRGLKLALHYGAPELPGPLWIDRTIARIDEEPVRAFLSAHMPTLNAVRQDASVCLYTLTPDRHFIVDRHPEHANVAVAAGFSGHGFKFAPVVGEMLADLTEGTDAGIPALFRFDPSRRLGSH